MRVAAVAQTQHGVITRAQLLAAGLGRGGIEHRVGQGRLHRVHVGVYLVGHALPLPLARELAAAFACGAGAVVSHRSAALLWGLVDDRRGRIVAQRPGDPGAAASDPIDVTVPRRHAWGRPGIRVHRAPGLEHRDRTSLCGVALTAPARTLLDLAGVAEPRELARAMEQGTVLGLARAPDLWAVLARYPTARGARSMRRALDDAREPALTRSRAEERMLALIRDAGLPAPRANVRVQGLEVDLHWPDQRLIVEVDGFRFHGTRRAFERDRRRDSLLHAAGERVMRVTWRQLEDAPLMVVAQVAGALLRG